MNIMLSCIEGSLEVSDSPRTKIIELYLEGIDSIPKPLQRIWVHSKDTLGFRLSHHYPSHLLLLALCLFFCSRERVFQKSCGVVKSDFLVKFLLGL
jgi:hypothetical protein